MAQKLLRFIARVIRLLAIMAVSILVLIFFLIMAVLIIMPRFRPWYHDPYIYIGIINYIEQPVKIEYLKIDSYVDHINKKIGNVISSPYGEHFGFEYNIEYNDKIRIGVKYKLLLNDEDVFFDAVVDRTRYKSCGFRIKISDTGNSISDCEYTEYNEKH